MRCSICNKQHAKPHGEGDFLCGECIKIVGKTTGREFNMEDLYELLLPNEDDLSMFRSKKK